MAIRIQANQIHNLQQIDAVVAGPDGCPSRKFNLTRGGFAWINLTVPWPELFVCLSGSRPSSSKHAPAT
jgi:hypothetical protein